jgi:hypothetical protein
MVLPRARVVQARVLPHGWLDAVRQVSLFGGAYLAYALVRGLAEGSAGAAFEHARQLIAFERTLHFFVEPSIQGWASGSHFVVVLASWLYVNAQTSVTIGALMYLYMRHNKNFYFVRNMFMIAMLVALIGYIVFPTAPPRFLPEWGFVDTVADTTGVKNNHESGAMSALLNMYAAVPSMHVAFALMISCPLARLARRRAVGMLWLLYPLLMTFVIVVTANPFIVDALLGALTAALAAYAASWLGRARPTVWRFSAMPSAVQAASGTASAA